MGNLGRQGRDTGRLLRFLELATPQVFLDWEKISKTVLEKVLIFILSGFFLIRGFVSKNVKNGPSER